MTEKTDTIMDVVKIKVITEGCMPRRADDGSWYDLFAAEDVIVPSASQFALNSSPTMVPLGVAMEIPEGMSAIIAARSSTPGRHGVYMPSGIGVVDSSYKGPGDQWMFPVYSINARGGFIHKGTKIAQFTLIRKHDIEFVEDNLEGNTNRGGFGSTGMV